MKVRFREGFVRDLKRIQDQDLLRRVRKVIHGLEEAGTLDELPQLKKLKGPGRYYRIRVGDYRLGLSVEEESVSLVRILHRKEIYRYFP